MEGKLLDSAYPGTAVARLANCLERLKTASLDGPWEDVRRELLHAGGLKEDRSTSHAFNDDNHCDLTTVLPVVMSGQNADGALRGISRMHMLGPHIQAANFPRPRRRRELVHLHQRLPPDAAV